MKDNEIVVGDLLYYLDRDNMNFNYLYCRAINKNKLYFIQFKFLVNIKKLIIRERYILTRVEWNDKHLIFKYFIKDDEAKHQLVERIFKVEIEDIRYFDK